MAQGRENGAGNGTRNGGDHHIQYIPLAYAGGDDSTASAMRLVTAVRPDWSDEGSKVEFARFTDGITNTLLKAVNKREGLSKEEVDKEAILLRAYGHGTDVIIDRHRETQNHELLMKNGLAPELLARFENGMMYRFIRGSVSQPEDLRKPTIYRAVARRLAEWHAVVPCIPGPTGHSRKNSRSDGVAPVGEQAFQRALDSVAPGKPPPNVWTVMQKWIFALPDATPEQRERQEQLQRELERLVDELSQRPGLGQNGVSALLLFSPSYFPFTPHPSPILFLSPLSPPFLLLFCGVPGCTHAIWKKLANRCPQLVFAHCDLLSGNVIVLPKSGVSSVGEKASETVAFIDYEYATPSPAAFDIANHFAEWGGFDCDFSVLPTRGQRREFISEYVHTYFKLAKDADASGDVDLACEINKLADEVDHFRGVPGFYWGIWALIQATISEIDFDYASYAEVRLGEYWAWRAELDGSRAASDKEMPLRERRWAQEA